MTRTLEQQLIDNENRVAIMASIIAAGIIAQSPGGNIRGDTIAIQSVALAEAIQKEVGKVAEKVRSEL
jgi:hypothetical protein